MIMQGNDNFPASSDKPDWKDVQVGNNWVEIHL